LRDKFLLQTIVLAKTMNKKRTNQAIPASPAAKSQQKIITNTIPTNAKLEPLPSTPTVNKWTTWMAMAMVALIAFGVFYNSRNNQFVLDDHGIIKSNKITKNGIGMDNIKTIFTTSHRKGDVSDLEHSLYRPVAKLIFAAEYQWGDGKPEYFHTWNIFYMILCSCLLYWLLYLATKKNWVLSLAIAGLFAVHPIHSEAVANIKSLDEVLGAIGVLGALISFHYYTKNNNPLLLALALISYTLGIFSKESTIVAVALAPLYLYYFTDADRKKIVIASVVMLIGAGIFLAAREHAIGWFLHQPQKDPSALDNVLAMTKLDQTKVGGYQMHLFIPTVIYLMGYYVYTLFIPYPLSCDYSFASVNVEGLDSWKFWLSFILFAAVIYFAIKTIKKKNIVGFGILWFLIASSIISNLFIVIGTSFGERLMFLPSIGWCIAVVGALYALLNYYKENAAEMSIAAGLKKHAMLFLFLGIVGCAYGWKTMDRNKDWYKDFTLFSRDVQYFGRSTHLLFYWGNHLSSSEYHEILKSQISSQNFIDSCAKLGYNNDQIKQIIDKEIELNIKKSNLEAIETFKTSMSIFPALPSDGYNQYGKAYYNLSDASHPTYLDSADYYYKKAHVEDTTNSVFLNNIGTIFFQRAIPMQRADFFDSAYKYFRKAYTKDTTLIDYMNNLGAITGTMASLPGQDPIGKRREAIDWFSKGYRSDSLSEGAILSCRSIAITYQAFGDSNSTRYWTNKAGEIQQYRMNKLQNGGF
jgi:tetratricopeptide (TPR) repeat protein